MVSDIPASHHAQFEIFGFLLMRHPSLHLLLLTGLVCGLLSSCLEDIDLDTGERILNVYCILREGPVQELELSYIAPTGGTSSPVSEDLTITLYDEGTPAGQFTRISETKWNLDYTPEGGHTYQLCKRHLAKWLKSCHWCRTRLLPQL